MSLNKWLVALSVLCIGLSPVAGYTICPEGYCRHSNGCYLVVNLKVSWIDAKSYCKVLGGALLSISSSTQRSAAEGALRRSVGVTQPGVFWLDITDLLNPKDWRSMDTRAALTFTNWDSGDDLIANVTDTKRCVTMSEERNYKWTAEDCAMKRNFVCFSSGTQQYYNRYGHNVKDDQPEC